jgi:hypothetical protein
MPGWPDPAIQWEYPDESSENDQRWQSAIDQSLRSNEPGSLRIDKVGIDVYDLHGDCPRCSHASGREPSPSRLKVAAAGLPTAPGASGASGRSCPGRWR